MKPILVCMMVLCSTIANAAIVLTPTSGILNFSRWEINQNSTLTTAEVQAIVNPLNPLTFEYKATPGGNDEGPLASSYVTTFNGDVSGGLIDYISGAFVSGSQKYLLIKDGNEDPSQYIFRISSFTIPGGPWNGTDDITMSGFWPQQGAISHISIYDAGPPGVPDQQDGPGGAVPEPTTLAIWGSMMIGLAAYRRKFC